MCEWNDREFNSTQRLSAFAKAMADRRTALKIKCRGGEAPLKYDF